MQQEIRSSNETIPATELIITDQGRIYHLDLEPTEIGSLLVWLEIKNVYQQFQNI